MSHESKENPMTHERDQQGRNTMKLTLSASTIVVGMLAIAMVAAPVVNATGSPGVVAPNKKTAGKSYSDWGNSWWQWFDAIPASVTPLVDTTGANCAQGQSGPVWFLAGTPSGNVDRDCTIPADKYIFYPLANGQEDQREAAFDSAAFADPGCPGVFGSAAVCNKLYNTLNPINTNHMRQMVDYIYSDVFDLLADPSTTGLFTSVDGNTVADIGSYRFDSGGGGYTITLPNAGTDNYHSIFGYSIPGPDTYKGAQVGYYVMLKPLSVGAHEIKLGRPGWVVTYHLTIQ
jgi:hypothetical protein